MSEPIKPALDSVEWAKWGSKITAADHFDSITARADAIDEALKDWEPASFHAAAAFALHGQFFGFTRDQLIQLRLLIDKAGSFQDAGPWGEGWQSRELEAAIKTAGDVADRIEALLPPPT